MTISIRFKLFRGGQIYRWNKRQYLKKTTDLSGENWGKIEQRNYIKLFCLSGNDHSFHRNKINQPNIRSWTLKCPLYILLKVVLVTVSFNEGWISDYVLKKDGLVTVCFKEGWISDYVLRKGGLSAVSFDEGWISCCII